MSQIHTYLNIHKTKIKTNKTKFRAYPPFKSNRFEYGIMLALEARDKYPKLYSMAMMGEKDLFQQMPAFWACSRRLMVLWMMKKCNMSEYV